MLRLSPYISYQTLLAIVISATAGILAVAMFLLTRKPTHPEIPPAKKYPPFAFPKEVQASGLLSHDAASCQLFNENLRRHTFAIIHLDNRSVELLANLEDAGRRFFQLSQDAKSRNRETGLGNNNIGYVNVEKVREYIKVSFYIIYFLITDHLMTLQRNIFPEHIFVTIDFIPASNF